jgi:hypothetical protein
MENKGKVYELIRDGECIQTEPKCREGLEELMDSVDACLYGDFPPEFQLEIVFVEYSDLGVAIDAEPVQKFDIEDIEDFDESMDGDFDSAMASAGFGTDEDYGCFSDETYGADF